MGGAASAGMHGAHGTASGPPVVGPLGSGYTPMLNSHHASSPPPTVPVASMGSAGGRPGANGYDSDDVETRLKRFTTNKPKPNGGASGMIGPPLSEGGSAHAKQFLMMMEQGRTNSGSPPTSASSAALMGGMASAGAMAGRPGAMGPGGTGGASTGGAGGVQTEALSNFFQSLMTRKGTMPPALGGGPGAGANGAPSAAAPSSASAASSTSASASASTTPSNNPTNNDA